MATKRSTGKAKAELSSKSTAAAAAAAAASSSSPSSSSSSSSLRSLPPPFESSSDNVQPFLSSLSKDRVYITHMDIHPRVFKRRVFTVPVILNLFILACLLWRLYTILPWYARISSEIFSGPSSPAERVRQARREGISFLSMCGTAVWRTSSLLIDYMLVTIVWSWPLTFFLERPHSPVSWRWRIGFRDRELVVRVSRGWSAADMLAGQKRGAESPFWKTRVLPAVGVEKMNKTGYVLMDASWDLDMAAMVRGTALLDSDEIKEMDVNGKVWAWLQDAGEWVSWDFGKHMYGVPSAAPAQQDQPTSPENDEARETILAFREKLSAMGKEDLFFKWVELIQYESSQPGGFTPERQQEAGRKVEELFKRYDVDFEEFGKSIMN